MNRFSDALAFTWRPENDGQAYHVTIGDNGGPTAWGVTIGSFAAWQAAHGKRVTVAADLKAAGKPALQELIRAWYWQAVQGDALPLGVDLLVYEFGFGSGPGTSIRALQQVLGVMVDGHLGPVTLAAAAARTGLLDALAARHAAFYQSLGQPQFTRGWLRRAGDRLALAKQWTGGSVATATLDVSAPRVAIVASDAAMTAALNDNAWQAARALA